jgi:xanthine/uracil permease
LRLAVRRGLATLLQTLGLPFFGCQLPLVQGVSFAGVATMGAILSSRAAVACQRCWRGHGRVADRLLITPVFSRITKFFPPLVTGIVITTIGLTLMPVARAGPWAATAPRQSSAAWPTSAWRR